MVSEIILPWPSAALSPNARGHWRDRQKATKAGKFHGFVAARAAGWTPEAVPEGRLHLWIDFYPPTARLPDDDNMLARCKAYRDGIAEALGVDDRRFVSHPYVREEPRKGGEVRIRITAGPAEALAAMGLTGIVGKPPRKSDHAPEPDRS